MYKCGTRKTGYDFPMEQPYRVLHRLLMIIFQVIKVSFRIFNE